MIFIYLTKNKGTKRLQSTQCYMFCFADCKINAGNFFKNEIPFPKGNENIAFAIKKYETHAWPSSSHSIYV